MDVICVDDKGCLFLSPKIEHWEPVAAHEITVVIDLEGELDHCVPTVPNHVLYLYFPIYDEDLPNLQKLDAVARLGASLVESGHKVNRIPPHVELQAHRQCGGSTPYRNSL